MFYCAITLVALVAILVLRTDSRGDGPKESVNAPAGAVATEQIETAPKLPTKLTANTIGETTVKKALATTADFNFIDTPLQRVADFIADHYKINVQLDTKILQNAGVTGDSTVTTVLKAVPLRTFLHFALAANNLASIEMDDNLLVITTADAAKSHMVQRVFDVRGFADPRNELLAEPDSWERLQEMITKVVAPSSWDANGGAGSISTINGELIVSQTEEVQVQVADLLVALELARGQDAAALLNGGGAAIPAPSAIRAGVERSLDSRVDMDFTETLLSKIVDKLQTNLGVPIQIDMKALADSGVSPETTFSVSLKQVRARVGLRELLAAKDLDFVIDHDIILITTNEIAKTTTETAVYPVGDLVTGAESILKGFTDYDTFLVALTDTIRPQSWIDNGGPGSIVAFPVGKVLVVNQTQDIHQEISGVLSNLRDVRKNHPGTVALPTSSPVVRIYSTATTDGKAAMQLIEIIRRLVEPKSWTDPDVYIGFAQGAIIVRQSPDVQRKVQHFLNALNGRDSHREFSGFGNS